jgi:hypothetical protein
LPAQLAQYRRDLDAIPPGDKTRREFVEWQIRFAEKRMALGSVLLLWGLKVAPVSSPFNSLVRDWPENAERGPGPITREHPWAVTSGAVLFLVGLALLVVAGVTRP